LLKIIIDIFMLCYDVQFELTSELPWKWLQAN